MNRPTIACLAAISAAGAASLAGAFAPGAPAPTAAPQACSSIATGDAVTIKHTLTLAGAERVIAAAAAEARSRDAGGAIAVVDDGGSLVAFHRLDGTFAAGSEVAIGKARTAALFRKPTAAFEDSIKGGRAALLGVREMTPLQGGIPIVHEGHVVGAIGVSGAHSQQEDEQIAMAGAAAVASVAGAPGK